MTTMIGQRPFNGQCQYLARYFELKYPISQEGFLFIVELGLFFLANTIKI